MSRSDRVTPLEHRAPIYVEVADGYVDIQQRRGDHTNYTPEEAREIATEIIEAAEAAEEATDGTVRLGD